MPDHDKPKLGSITWTDLTVPDAEAIQDFYREVVGWEVEAASMGDYDDYVVKTAGGTAVGGICHARGGNANYPAHWLPYITVQNIDQSIARCSAMGGTVIVPIRDMGGYGRSCVIKDPAGAVSALIESPSPQ